MNISDEAVEAAFDALGREYGDDAYCRERQYIRTTLEAALPLLSSQRALDAVLDISNVVLDSEHGDPAFIAGWEAALEEVQARIHEATNPHRSQA